MHRDCKKHEIVIKLKSFLKTIHLNTSPVYIIIAYQTLITHTKKANK